MKQGKKDLGKNSATYPAAGARPLPPAPMQQHAKGPAPEKHGLLHIIFNRPRPVPNKHIQEPIQAQASAARTSDASPARIQAKIPAVPAIQSTTHAKPLKKVSEPGAMSASVLRMYRRLSAAMPHGLVTYFEKKMRYAGVDPEQSVLLLGRTILISCLVGIIPLMLYLVIFNPIATTETVLIAAGLFFGGVILSVILHYMSLYFRIADRSAAVEKMLPDFLSLAVSNLRSGVSPYSAFVQAARPEFGEFHDAVIRSMAKMGGKGSIADALQDVSENFDSPILRRTVTLFAKGVRSGGQLVRLLSSSADEVRRIQDLRAELVSSTRTYSIFLSFIVVAVMPFLLAVSTNFVSVFVGLQMDTTSVTTTLPGGSQIPSFTGKILVTPDDMQNISIITLVTIDFLVSILIGLIDRGKAIYGVKSFPLLVILSLVAFIIAKAFIGSFLSGFML